MILVTRINLKEALESLEYIDSFTMKNTKFSDHFLNYIPNLRTKENMIMITITVNA